MKIDLQKIKLGFFGLVLFLQAFMFISPNISSAASLTNPIDTTQPASSTLPIYQGVDGSIKDYLCTPTGQGTDLYDCIGRLYRFGISAGAVALVFFIVMAGYMYITGGESAKGKAKGVILSALTGMGILLGSYTLLSFINPELVKIKMIQPPIFNALDLPKCEEVGFGEKCIISVGAGSGQVYQPPVTAKGCSNKDSGGCTRANISANCPKMGERMDDALRVCNHESGGGQVTIASSTDLCLDDANKKVSFSHGLWQINITNSASPTFPECENVLKRGAALDGCAYPFRIGGSGSCVVKLNRCEFPKGRAAYEACRKALNDPARNTKQACILFERAGRSASRGAWQPWPYTERTVCKIPIWKF